MAARRTGSARTTLVSGQRPRPEGIQVVGGDADGVGVPGRIG
jgi:hypothetical protein